MEYFAESERPDPKSLTIEDMWRQIRRTVKGQAVSEDQIQMIVNAVVEGLAFDKPAVLLDIACGNGALSHYLFDRCSGFLGVDRSDYFIEVAQAHFQRPPAFTFTTSDAAAYVVSESEPERFTKALCYGSFSYFPEDDAHQFLSTLRRRFINVDRLYIGNLPDLDLAGKFYPADQPLPDLKDEASQIGIWRTESEMARLAESTGWRAEFVRMPAAFYAGHYRYDVVLTLLMPRSPDSAASQDMEHMG